MTTSHHETNLRDEVDRLKRKVAFYIDLLNRTAQERDEAREQARVWSDHRFIWVQQHPVTGLEIAQVLYSDSVAALAESDHVSDPETWSLWMARPVQPAEPEPFAALLAAAADLDGGTNTDRRVADNIRHAVDEVAREGHPGERCADCHAISESWCSCPDGYNPTTRITDEGRT